MNIGLVGVVLLTCTLVGCVGPTARQHDATLGLTELKNGLPFWQRFEVKDAHFVNVLSFLEKESNAVLPEERKVSFVLSAYLYPMNQEFVISLGDLRQKRYPADSYWANLTSSRFLCSTSLRKVTVEQVLDALKNQVGYVWSKQESTYTVRLREHW